MPGSAARASRRRRARDPIGSPLSLRSENLLVTPSNSNARTAPPPIRARLPYAGVSDEDLATDQVCRCILGLRQLLRSSRENPSYLHDDEHMIVTHTVRVQGPLYETDMTFAVAITFDANERVKSVAVEPSDLGVLRPRRRHGPGFVRPHPF